mmetsp:Transcript_15221/g.34402  ORF Transcript_15221/g.34402 Transcript_15221/m.34402 type:complete len:156 (+) Transcript_15221:154-621(+)
MTSDRNIRSGNTRGGGTIDEVSNNSRSNGVRAPQLEQSQQNPDSNSNWPSSTAAAPNTANSRRRRRKKKFAVSTRWEREVAEHGPINDFHRFCCCCSRRLGNMFVLCERSDGTPIVIAGPCWPFCIFVTLPLILAVSGAVAYFVIISDDSPLVSD